MKERGIIFKGKLVIAILNDIKTETRRILKLPKWSTQDWNDFEIDIDGKPVIICEKTGCLSEIKCPYGKIGDRLWVRETWWRKGTWHLDVYNEEYEFVGIKKVAGYCATDDKPDDKYSKKIPSIFMFRWASRINLEITDIKNERVQDITDKGALAEGVDQTNTSIPGYAKTRFQHLWDSINKKLGHEWIKNDRVWVIKFKRIDT